MTLDQAEYGAVAQEFDEFFLFTTGGCYIGPTCPQIICLDSQEIRAFAQDSYNFMPGSIRLFMDLAAEFEHAGVSNKPLQPTCAVKPELTGRGTRG